MSALRDGYRGTVRRYDTTSFATALIAESHEMLAAMWRVASGSPDVAISEVPVEQAVAVAQAEACDRIAELQTVDPAGPYFDAGYLVSEATADALSALAARGGVVLVEIRQEKGGPSPTAFGFMLEVQREMLREEVTVEF